MARETKPNEFSIWKVDFNDLAKQICLKDLELFKAISIQEIDSFNWTKTSKKALCPNLMISNKQFNKINLWVQKEILDQKTSLVGVKLLSRFINLSKRLLDQRNFQSAYAVKSALHSTPIYRLEYFWSEISKKDKVTWEKLSFIFNVENNYINLRNVMSEKRRPSIPFIGLYLCDLTGLDAAYPKVEGIESEPRRSGMNKIYDSIRYFQSSKYDFKLHSDLQDYLHSMEYMEEFQNYIIDTLFHLSKALEPDISSQNHNNSSFHKDNHFHLTHRKSKSLEPNECRNYRQISEDERERVILSSPDSPRILLKENEAASTLRPSNIRYLLDDSVAEPNPETQIVPLSKDHCISVTQNGSTASIGTDEWVDVQPIPDIEITISQFIDPHSLAQSPNYKIIVEGLVKRKFKMKSSTLCSSNSQKVLARLCTNSVDCYLSFSLSKNVKSKAISDFQFEAKSTISLISAELKYQRFLFNPKIIINQPHEVCIIKSIDEVGEYWPSLDDWWKFLNDSVESVKSSKAAAFQNSRDLINLEDDFTRL